MEIYLIAFIFWYYVVFLCVFFFFFSKRKLREEKTLHLEEKMKTKNKQIINMKNYNSYF